MTVRDRAAATQRGAVATGDAVAKAVGDREPGS